MSSFLYVSDVDNSYRICCRCQYKLNGWNSSNNIIIFDVTPVSNQWIKDNGYSDVFYTYKNMKKFILKFKII